MAINIISIINTLRSDTLHLRTLGQIWVERDTISWGSNSVTARCRVSGKEGSKLIKCYIRHHSNAQTIYGDSYYPAELGILTLCEPIVYADIAILPWVEGTPLESILWSEDADYKALSKAFDRLALKTLESEYAHGDIKPENIIVKPDGEMELIDFDACWHPNMTGYDADEIGTYAYRHPYRDNTNFGKHIDDYPIALISTMLASLAADRETMIGFVNEDMYLIDPANAIEGKDRALQCAISLFERLGDAPHLRIAEILERKFISNISLIDYIRYATTPSSTTIPSNAVVARQWHLYGMHDGDRWVVPPLYDWCDEPKDGLCRLTLGDHEFDIAVED